jgi:hypothetical protein
MFSLFKMSPRKMRDQQLLNAQVSLVQHKQAAAYHAAMSNYLSGEVDRLSAEVAAEKEVAKFDAQQRAKCTPPAARPMAYSNAGTVGA